MLIFGLFVGVVCGIALPHVPRTASGGGFPNTTSILPAAASTSAIAAASTAIITSAATLPSPAVPSGWVKIPDTITFPCELLNDCYGGYTGTDWPPPAAPSTANWAGDAHLSQPAPWLVDPYHHVNEYSTDATYDSICGMQWYSSLEEWMSTAPTALGPTIAASDVYEIVIGTTTKYLFHTESDMTFFWTSSTIYDYTSKGVVYTTTGEVDINSPSPTWQSSSTVTSIVSGFTSLLSTRSTHRDTYWVSAFTFTPSAPCCSSCTVLGGTVQVLNWPTPAPQPPVSILVDAKNNYTFTSPSVYVAFDSLYATNLCGTLGSQVYTSTTIAFAPGELSTSLIYTVDGTVTNYMDFFSGDYTAVSAFDNTDCSPQTTTVFDLHGFTTFTDMKDAMSWSATNTEVMGVEDSLGVWQQAAYSTMPNVVTTYTVIHNPCSPALSVPTLLYSLQPLWTGCLPGISAFFDPPYTLTTGGPMGLVTKTSPVPALPQSGGPTATPPKPGVTPKPGMPTPTLGPGNSAPSPNPNPPQNPSNPPLPGPHAPNPNPDPAPAPSAFIVAGQTLAQGAPPVTMSGHTVSLAPGGSNVVIDATKTVPLASFLADPPSAVGAVGGSPTNGGGSGTQASESGNAGQSGGAGGGASTSSGGGSGNGAGGPSGGVGYVFGTQTLMPGSQITVSGEILSLLPDGSSVVIIDPPTQTGLGFGSGVGVAGTTKTEGISALLGNIGGSTSTGSQTGTGGVLQQTGKSGVVGRYTGHDRLTWALGALGGLWILGLGLL